MPIVPIGASFVFLLTTPRIPTTKKLAYKLISVVQIDIKEYQTKPLCVRLYDLENYNFLIS
ncbi:hypothetical protein CXF72_13830 [Psychromonas sp. MB-3u-54]|nr:hypothetical protein CXF72_13830 [Psychromonas sp. MB-3u-54]